MAWSKRAAVLLLLATAASARAGSWGEDARLWRNVTQANEYDAEMAAIDAMVDPRELSEEARHVRALISRFDAIDHYRAADNLELIVRAIGAGTYPRYPAVDVLMRGGTVDEQRRAAFAEWARALTRWSQGQTDSTTLPLGAGAFRPAALLGERTPEKAWLAASLGRTLEAFAFTPADYLAGLSEEAFVQATYRAVLGRDPSADDLGFRVSELAAGKRREAMVTEIASSPEARQRLLWQVLESAVEPEEGRDAAPGR